MVCCAVFYPAHLWSSIFNMAFDLGLVEDAYTAALSNPQHDLAEEKIRRLVLALLEQGKTTWAALQMVLANHLWLHVGHIGTCPASTHTMHHAQVVHIEC